MRQLRNNVERLMILAGGDPDAVITADMLPPDVGSMIPSMPNGNGGEQLMSLALREAREVFEREYLLAQINRFGGNISRTAEFVGMERSALHRKLKALGIDRKTERHRRIKTLLRSLTALSPGRLIAEHRLRQRPLSAACATPRSTSRIAAISSPTASTKSARCGEGG